MGVFRGVFIANNLASTDNQNNQESRLNTCKRKLTQHKNGPNKHQKTNSNKKLKHRWQTCATRLYIKVTKHSTIPYVKYSFLLCNSNFVFKSRRFYVLQKCRDLEIGVRGHSMSLKVAPFDRFGVVSY